jgi:hypothetical protein
VSCNAWLTCQRTRQASHTCKPEPPATPSLPRGACMAAMAHIHVQAFSSCAPTSSRTLQTMCQCQQGALNELFWQPSCGGGTSHAAAHRSRHTNTAEAWMTTAAVAAVDGQPRLAQLGRPELPYALKAPPMKVGLEKTSPRRGLTADTEESRPDLLVAVRTGVQQTYASW